MVRVLRRRAGGADAACTRARTRTRGAAQGQGGALLAPRLLRLAGDRRGARVCARAAEAAPAGASGDKADAADGGEAEVAERRAGRAQVADGIAAGPARADQGRDAQAA